MNSIQYEELCRFFLAEKVGIPPEEILSVRIPNPKRKDLPQYSHQIDLYWETGDDAFQYLHIANAKWRGTDKVDQPDVMLLQQVKDDVQAHKAVMITNTESTSGADAVAQDKGIALHIVRPKFDVASLPLKERPEILVGIQKIASLCSQPVYEHVVVQRGFNFAASVSEQPSTARPGQIPHSHTSSTRHQKRVVTGYTHRGGPSSGGRNRGGFSGQSRGGGPRIRNK